MSEPLTIYTVPRTAFVPSHPGMDTTGLVEVVMRDEAEALRAERDRSWTTINEIEKALSDHGVPITAPLADAILAILYDLEQETR